MSAEDVTADLKNRGLPTFGTNQERKDRLKKYYGRFTISHVVCLTLVLGVDHVPSMLLGLQQ